MDSVTKARRALNRRRAQLRAVELERRKREFDKLPAKQRRICEMIGWSPYQNEAQIRRISGTIATK